MENIVSRLLQILLTLPAILFSLSVHELCHGYAAHLLGDPTPKASGRLSLNPLKHIDPFGFFALLFFRVGWAKPVMVNSRYFKKPKRDMAITALAGPVSNFILALIFSFLFVLLNRIGNAFSLYSADSMTPYQVFCLIVYLFIPINLGLGVFNLIPIPPLDGSKILYAFLPGRVIFKILPYENYIRLALIVLLCLGFLDVPISVAVGFFENLFMNLAEGVFLYGN